MIRFILNLFRRRPIIVQTYSVRRTDLAQLRDLKHAELARSLGRTWKDR
jgi:hypothetical protein